MVKNRLSVLFACTVLGTLLVACGHGGVSQQELYQRSYSVRDEILREPREWEYDEEWYLSDSDETHYANGYMDNCIDVFFNDGTSFDDIVTIAANNGMYVTGYIGDMKLAQFTLAEGTFASMADVEAKAESVVANSDGKLKSAYPEYLSDDLYIDHELFSLQKWD
jgi:hypothetical protein